ncbi:MAG: TonB-dependent receptor [Bacteroidales bacterium]|nr:TonB-dependent receptor [Bacteroidales bacterium]
MNGISKKTTMLLGGSLLSILAYGQQTKHMEGIIKSQSTGEGIPYATVVLYQAQDSTLITGTTTDFDGEWKLKTGEKGNYYLKISHTSYKPVEVDVKPCGKALYQAGTLLLEEKSVRLEKLIVYGERIRAKDEKGKTTFFMNKKIQAASYSGLDAIKHIPGVQVDMMHHVSLAGSRNIVVLVNNKERDISYLNQLGAEQIDKIEVMQVPDANYSADANGVINVILKEQKKGINGQIYGEIPTSKSEVYLFPNYSIHYGREKLNFYTSYNGELSNFNIIQNEVRRMNKPSDNTAITTVRKIRQNNWSHRFHAGIDYHLNEKNQLNFYGYFNPYSNEHDGDVMLKAKGTAMDNEYWSAHKADTDLNYLTFSSLYYKHLFNKSNELTLDVSYYNLNARNNTRYSIDSSTMSFSENIDNTLRPVQHTGIVKIDYTSRPNERWNFAAGAKGRLRQMEDRNQKSFSYHEDILAGYGKISFTASPLFISAGTRVEKSVSGMPDRFDYNDLAWLPSANISYQLNKKQNIKLAFRRTVHRPNIYQLNPAVSVNDPFAIHSGNPRLQNETSDEISLTYSLRSAQNYLSGRLFYNKSSRVFNDLMFVNNNTLVTEAHNMGGFHRYGLQFKGALKPFNFFSMNPYFRIYEIETFTNKMSEQYNIFPVRDVGYESGLSAVFSLKYGITASMMFQYNSPEVRMQKVAFEDALYFMGIEKKISKNFRAGIKTAIPFKRNFTYYGEEIEGKNFYRHSAGDIRMSTFPVWFRLSYRFASGKTIEHIGREKEKVEKFRDKGF